MSKLQRCKACKGSKYVLGMGGMKKDCYACGKTGFVEIDSSEDEDEVLKSKSKVDKRSKEYRDQNRK